ncbi:S-layer homology domain-containing protein [Anaerospora hongkongensis]|uniref:S-layer homology domain-containing protein n=1 Tax=Anaerospora hongkongensis TaxID=244830 RepID=UPI0028A01236|nr:S-layer homology domain-containing protein [Anaerospora hongkongensis]
MKKKIAAALAVTFALGVTSAFAANPFVDVPAKHWAYDAVSKLAQAGIVDGYGDGTFRGDKNITRYEMAQIVAKALAKEDKANAEQKALLNKLSAEFSEELDNLGVRVSKLEKNAPTVKISADARIRGWENPAVRAATGKGDATVSKNQFDQRFRLYVDGKVNDSVDFKSRFAIANKSNSDVTAAEDKSFTFDYGYFTFKNAIGNANLSVGRHDLVMGYSLVSDITGGYDAVKVAFGGDKVKAIVGYGDISNRTGVYSTDATKLTAARNNKVNGSDISLTTAEIKYTPSSSFQTIGTVYYSNTKGYNYEVYGLGAKAKLGDNFTLTGEYATNEASDIGVAGVKDDHAWNALLGYKGANRANPKSFGLFVNYKKFGADALDYKMNSNPVFQGIDDEFTRQNGVKGLGYGFNYTFSKNMIVTATYEDLKSYNGDLDRDPYTFVRADFWF